MSESVFAFRADTLAKLIKRDQAAERITDFLKNNLAALPQELQDQAKSLVSERDDDTNTQWGPRRVEQ